MRVLRHTVVAVLIVCGVVWAVSVAFLWANETRIVYRTHRSRASAVGATPTTLYLRTSDGVRLEALKLEGDDEPRDARWILFFHGSAHSIHNWRVRVQLEQLRDLGYTVLAPEYRGFGRNEGTPSESGLYEDAMTAYRYVTAQVGVPPSRVVVAGRSLGSAVAVDLASRVPLAGVMLLSPIDSIVRMGARMYPWVPVRLLASSRFDSLGKIGRVRAPVVVIHAADDRWVPIEAARSLFGEARSPKLMLETLGGHNGAGFEDVVQLRDALARFWPAAPQPQLSSIDAAAGMLHRAAP
jgi:pimeloyl-ACP methyl ester carboxylesterase